MIPDLAHPHAFAVLCLLAAAIVAWAVRADLHDVRAADEADGCADGAAEGAWITHSERSDSV